METNEKLKKIKKKMIIESILNSLLNGFIFGILVTILLTLILYLIGFKNILVSIIIMLVLSLALSSYFYFSRFRPTLKKVARRIDQLGLQERVITSIEYEEDEGLLARLLKEDTNEKLDTFKMELVKLKINKKVMIAVISSIVVFIGILFIPARSFSNILTPGDSVSEDLPSESESEEKNEDEIIDDLLDEIRDIIDKSEIDEELKDQLNEKVDQLEEDLKDENLSLEEKIDMIEKTKEEIEDIIENALAKYDLGTALSRQDETKTLGIAIKKKDLDGVDTSLDQLKNLLATLDDEAFADKINQYQQALQTALDIATNEKNEALIAAVEKFKESLKDANRENIDEIIETAKQEIKEALIEYPEDGQKDKEDLESTEEEISDAMQDALDQLKDKLDQDSQDEKDEDSDSEDGDENGDSDDESNPPPYTPDDPLQSEPIIDGNTPYLEVYDEYYDQIMEMLSSGDIPDEMREIVEKYLAMLK